MLTNSITNKTAQSQLAVRPQKQAKPAFKGKQEYAIMHELFTKEIPKVAVKKQMYAMPMADVVGTISRKLKGTGLALNKSENGRNTMNLINSKGKVFGELKLSVGKGVKQEYNYAHYTDETGKNVRVAMLEDVTLSEAEPPVGADVRPSMVRRSKIHDANGKVAHTRNV